MSREGYLRVLNRYYKRERDRTEQCLSDISEILGSEGEPNDRETRVLDRLIQHWSRADEKPRYGIAKEDGSIEAFYHGEQWSEAERTKLEERKRKAGSPND